MLTANQSRALTALLACSTRKEAAQAAGLSERTLRAYLENEEFLTEYRRAFAALIEESTREAQRAMQPALATLRNICEDEECPPAARISAARSLMDMGLKLTEQNDILARLEVLERAYHEDHR